MKRFLLSVFAAAAMVAMAAPSMASDVTVSGQYLLRSEYSNNKDFDGGIVSATGKSANDHQDFTAQRVRLTSNVKATDDTSVKITLQDTRVWGATSNANGGPGLTDTGGAAVAAGSATAASNVTDLHESYLNVDNVFGSGIAVKVGRQELNYGDQRLIGSFGWSANGRSFDAANFYYKSKALDLDVFRSTIVENTTSNTDMDFYGIYSTVKVVPDKLADVDVYLLRLIDKNTTTAGTAFGQTTLGNTSLQGSTLKDSSVINTFGFRVKGGAIGIDYTAEFVPLQTGTVTTYVKSYKIKGSAYAIKGGYTLPVAKLRVGLEYDYASGDKDGTDEKITTFFNLFPTNHDKYGYADQQGWRNMKAYALAVSAEPLDKVKVEFAYWNFKLAQKADAWYGAANWESTPGGNRAASTTNTATDVGSEIDLRAIYKYNSSVSLDLGYSRFLPGKFIKNQTAYTATTPTKKIANMDWAYLMVVANF
ncbi:MAG: alginate export family protein [Deltaproteobacteria bacterium]|nr:alginate export family protein [Deltaproteobacteria bacterium]